MRHSQLAHFAASVPIAFCLTGGVHPKHVCQLCAKSGRGKSMAGKAEQIIPRGGRNWLARVFMGLDPESGKRKYVNKTIHGTLPGCASVPQPNPAGSRRGRLLRTILDEPGWLSRQGAGPGSRSTWDSDAPCRQQRLLHRGVAISWCIGVPYTPLPLEISSILAGRFEVADLARILIW